MSKKSELGIAGNLLLFLNSLAVFPFVAFVLSKLWAWFITPHYVNSLNKWELMGASFLLSYATYFDHRELFRERDDKERIQTAISSWVRGGFVLLIGYGCKLLAQ
jgi:hypothetical protein